MIYMFADDTKLYKGISKNADRQQLQSDIDILVTWSTKWKLLFNLDKCKVMTHWHWDILLMYLIIPWLRTMGSISVYRSRSHLERDLGIMIDSELNFSEHMHMVSKNTNGIMAVIKRTFTCLDFEQWRSHGGGSPHLSQGPIVGFVQIRWEVGKAGGGGYHFKMSASEYLRCAPKYTISRLNNQNFSGEGAQPPPQPPHPTPLGTFGASLLAPSALVPPTQKSWLRPCQYELMYIPDS